MSSRRASKLPAAMVAILAQRRGRRRAAAPPGCEDGAPMRDAFLLDPDIVFLNHGSFGACPKPVFEAYQRWQLRARAQPGGLPGPPLGRAAGRRAPSTGRLPRRARRRPGLRAQCHPRRQHRRALAGACSRATRCWPPTTSTAPATRPGNSSAAQRGAQLPSRARCRCPSTPAQLGAAAAGRGHAAHARRLRQPHHVDHGAHLPGAGAVRGARRRGITTVIDGAHAPGQIALDLAARGRRLLHRQLPQVAVRAQGRGLPARAARTPGRTRRRRRELGLCRRRRRPHRLRRLHRPHACSSAGCSGRAHATWRPSWRCRRRSTSSRPTTGRPGGAAATTWPAACSSACWRATAWRRSRRDEAFGADGGHPRARPRRRRAARLAVRRSTASRCR